MMSSTRFAPIGRRTRGMVGMMMVAAALVATTPSAQAAGPAPLEPGHYRMAYQSATASSMAPRADGTYSGTSLYVFRNDQGTQVCIENVQYDAANTLISEYGCAGIPEQAFTLDKKLQSATLAPTMVTLNTFDCQEATGCMVASSRNVEVTATMQGAGELQKIKSRSLYDDGRCTYQNKNGGEVRTAITNVTLNGENINGAGSLAASQELTVVRCD